MTGACASLQAPKPPRGKAARTGTTLTASGRPLVALGRDGTLDTFHALGKLLYNKRGSAEDTACPGQPSMACTGVSCMLGAACCGSTADGRQPAQRSGCCVF